MTVPRRLAAIMFTDLVGSTELAQSDEKSALALLREQERVARPLLATHHGRWVKSTGDGMLAEFANALEAVECAVELQRSAHVRDGRDGKPPCRLRIGIHLGDVEHRRGDVQGDAVNIASRVETMAESGCVCLSAPVYDQVRNKVPYQFEELGPKSLKGVREPMYVYRVVLPWVRAEIRAGRPAPPRLAVLPLANISPDPKDEYFADGLTEELISVLSQIQGLRVIARTSVTPYKSTPKPVAQIGIELGVDSVLEGSVRKVGDRLRISIQLIDARTQEPRWSQSLDRKLEDVFAIQAEVADRTAGALRVELLRSEREAIRESPTSSVAAYESYLRGVQAHRNLPSSQEEEITRVAEAYFEEAIREDPRFSAAYASLATLLIGAMGDTRPASEVVPRARELVAKAIALDPSSADARTAAGNLAMQVDLDWSRAEAEFQQAISLSASSTVARFWYSFLLQVLQRFEEAKKQYLAAIPLDPLWAGLRLGLVTTYELSGDVESAIDLCEGLANSFHDDLGVRLALAWAYALAGRTGAALSLLETLTDPTRPSSRLLIEPWSPGRSAILAYIGRPKEARAALTEWEEGRSTGYLSPGIAAAYYALWGEKDRSLSLLERDLEEGDPSLWMIYQTPFFDTVRGEPRFVALLRAMHLPTTLTRAHRSVDLP